MKDIIVPGIRDMLFRASQASPPPWTTEFKGWEGDPEGCEAVIHLNDKSRNFDSWGWGSLNRIIVYGTGIGQNTVNGKDMKRAKANVEFIAHARTDTPLLAKLLMLTVEELTILAENPIPPDIAQMRAKRMVDEIRRVFE
jgi:hypothetical protein